MSLGLDEGQIRSLLTTTIGNSISGLHRLSVAIRQSTKAKLDQRAISYAGRTLQEEKRLLQGELFDRAFLSHKFPLLDIDSPGVGKRLRNAMSKRRRRLYYQRQHYERVYVRPHIPVFQTPVARDDKMDVDRRGETEGLTAQISQNPPQALATKSATTSERHDPTIDAGRVQQIRASGQRGSLREKSVIQNSYLNFPQIPKASKGSHEVVCPYCNSLLPSEDLKDEARWRKHLMLDIEPYVCILPNCGQQNNMFSTTHEWFQHMLKPHQGFYYCSAPPHTTQEKFHDVSAFNKHMHDEHQHSFTDAQLPALASAALRSAAPFFNDCPMDDNFIVGDFVNSPSDIFATVPLREHVIKHLKELALLAVVGINTDNSHDLALASEATTPRERSIDVEDENDDGRRNLLAEEEEVRELASVEQANREMEIAVEHQGQIIEQNSWGFLGRSWAVNPFARPTRSDDIVPQVEHHTAHYSENAYLDWAFRTK